MTHDPYDILGVPRTASADDVRRAYRQRVKSEHPDKHGGDEAAHERFLLLQTAFELLSDPSRRQTYDTHPESAWSWAEGQVRSERRRAQLVRRRRRLRRLWD